MNCCMVNRLALGVVFFVSRSFRALGWRACRFYPTCSAYAQQAIKLHGPFSGLRMTAGRLLRCHPWNPGGIDLPEMESR